MAQGKKASVEDLAKFESKALKAIGKKGASYDAIQKAIGEGEFRARQTLKSLKEKGSVQFSKKGGESKWLPAGASA